MHVNENPGKRSRHVIEERERDEEVEERRRMEESQFQREILIVLFTKSERKVGQLYHLILETEISLSTRGK